MVRLHASQLGDCSDDVPDARTTESAEITIYAGLVVQKGNEGLSGGALPSRFFLFSASTTRAGYTSCYYRPGKEARHWEGAFTGLHQTTVHIVCEQKQACADERLNGLDTELCSFDGN